MFIGCLHCIKAQMVECSLVTCVCALGVTYEKAQLLGCVQVVVLLSLFKCGGLTTHFAANNIHKKS